MPDVRVRCHLALWTALDRAPCCGERRLAGCEATVARDCRSEGREGCAARYFRLVRNWFRCVVQSEPPVAFVAQLPCQPQTQVIVCSRCLYWSMT